MSRYSSAWLKDNALSEEEFNKIYEAYTDELIFQQLAVIIKSRLKELDKAPDYKNPSWSHEQAHRNGQKESLKEILNLLPLTDRRY